MVSAAGMRRRLIRLRGVDGYFFSGTLALVPKLMWDEGKLGFVVGIFVNMGKNKRGRKGYDH